MITNTCTSGLSRSQPDNRRKSLVQAYGNWLNTLTWDYYCTFTTRYQMTVKSARRTMIKLHNHLNERYNCSAKVFWVAEPFDTKYGCHLHALIEVENKTSVTKIDLKNAWQVVSKGKGKKEYNNTTIKEYDKNKGGHFYFSKYLHRQGIDYDIF